MHPVLAGGIALAFLILFVAVMSMGEGDRNTGRDRDAGRLLNQAVSESCVALTRAITDKVRGMDGDASVYLAVGRTHAIALDAAHTDPRYEELARILTRVKSAYWDGPVEFYEAMDGVGAACYPD